MIDQNKLERITANVGDMNLKRRVHTILKKLEVRNNDVVLDCGCGDGLFLEALSELSDCHLHGFELDEKELRLAQQHLTGKQVKLILGDLLQLPYRDSSFDKIYCTEVLEHVVDDRKALQELKRVLKKGGLLIVTVPNHNYPFLWDPINKILEFLFKRHIQNGFWAGIWNKHPRLYYLSEIRTLIESFGFRVKERLALTHYCIPLNHVILYGLKQILNKGFLPKSIQHTGDKFSWKEQKQSTIIKMAYWFLNRIDRLNDNIPPYKSSVNILIKAQKV